MVYMVEGATPIRLAFWGSVGPRDLKPAAICVGACVAARQPGWARRVCGRPRRTRHVSPVRFQQLVSELPGMFCQSVCRSSVRAYDGVKAGLHGGPVPTALFYEGRRASFVVRFTHIPIYMAKGHGIPGGVMSCLFPIVVVVSVTKLTL
jgi:hypothetical protein